MNIVVTGVAGYIGGQVALQLKDAGHTVVGIDRRPLQPHQKGLLDNFVLADFDSDSAPRRSSSTSGVSETLSTTASAPVSASFNDAICVTPSINGRPAVRFQPRTVCPARARCPAIGAPIVPRPRNVTLLMTPRYASAAKGVRRVVRPAGLEPTTFRSAT